MLAAVERHRLAAAVFNARCDPDPDPDPELDELIASEDAMLATVPTSLAGCAALALHVIEIAEDPDDFGWARHALQLLTPALIRLRDARPVRRMRAAG
jgi:hypothetical protein